MPGDGAPLMHTRSLFTHFLSQPLIRFLFYILHCILLLVCSSATYIDHTALLVEYQKIYSSLLFFSLPNNFNLNTPIYPSSPFLFYFFFFFFSQGKLGALSNIASWMYLVIMEIQMVS